MHGNFEFIESEGVTESYKCMYQIKSGEVELRHIFSDSRDRVWLVSLS